jgi:cytoskeletal protein RodZ
MFGSDVLDIVVGMVFIFLLLSLICSAVKEFIETLVKHRAKDLERGIRELIGDPDNTTDFVANIYNHALVNSLYRGTYSEKSKGCLPSYIPSANFAIAVMDLIKNPPAGIKLPPNVKAAYDIFEQRAAGNAATLQASLEEWFNTGMDRVSGWYKRRSQWILLTLGLMVAVVINADTISIAQRLSNDASLRKGLVAMAQAKATQPLPAVSNVQTPASVPATSPNPASTDQTAPTDTTSAQPLDDGAANANPATAGQNAAQTSTAPAAASTPVATLAPAPAAAPSAGNRLQQIQQYTAQLDQIGLPIGWQSLTGPTPPEGLVKHVVNTAPAEVKRHWIGWILTAIAISMGAPFWFDLLDKIIAVRTALKPQSGS